MTTVGGRVSVPLLLALLAGLGQLHPATSVTDPTPPRQTFKAAVYEHAVLLPEDPKQVVSRQEALQLMRRNLAVYAEQAAEAKRQGADILVFPEDGLYGFSFSWQSMESYLEFIPDPKVVHWIPCDDPARFERSEVQQFLSCLAKKHGLYLVANMGDSQPCHPHQVASCNHQAGGGQNHFQFNTDVAFDPRGKLVARYHKKHLFFEKQFDVPEVAEISTFDTPFGRWAMFTCFDILFYEPAVAAVEREGVANVAFPTAWMDALPLLASVQFHSAFARGLGVNVLAANIHLPKYRFQGSGVYSPRGQAAFVHNATVSSPPRLIVAELDVLHKPQPQSMHEPEDSASRAQSTRGQANVTSDVQERHPKAPPPTAAPPAQPVSSESHSDAADVEDVEIAFVSELFHDLFNFVQLVEANASLRSCSGNVCCHLTYSMSPAAAVSGDLFAFGAFDGLHTYEGRYYLQICALVRCANQSRSSCGTPTNQSATMFHSLSLQGQLETQHVYPEVLLTTDTGQLRLAGAEEWSFYGRGIQSPAGFSSPLLAVALFGRDYFRDAQQLDDPLELVEDSALSLSLHRCLVILCAFVGFVSS